MIIKFLGEQVTYLTFEGDPEGSSWRAASTWASTTFLTSTVYPERSEDPVEVRRRTMFLIWWLESFQEASPDAPRGYTHGPKMSGGQNTVRSKAPPFDFGGVGLPRARADRTIAL